MNPRTSVNLPAVLVESFERLETTSRVLLRALLLRPTSARVKDRLSVVLLCLGFGFGACHECFAQSDPLSNWHWRNPLPTGAYLNSVAYGNGLFVATGAGIMASADGAEWSVVYAPSNSPTAVTYGNGIFVAVGARVTATSTNGLDWESTDQGIAQSLYAVAYGNGRFVAVGGARADLPLTFTSSNGVDWAAGGTNAAFWLFGVTYANGIFVAVGENLDSDRGRQETRILTSEDGLHWAQQQLPPEPIPPSDTNGVPISEPGLLSVTYGQGQFVAVGYKDWLGPLILTSADGTNWFRHYYSGDTTLTSVVYGSGRFVAFGSHWPNGDGYPLVLDLLTSTDGVNWAPEFPRARRAPEFGAVWGGGTFVAVGAYGEIISSTNGLDWTNRTKGFYGPDWDLNGIGTDGHLIVAVGGGILVSTNALNWTDAFQGGGFQDVIHAQGKWVAVGGGIATSDDGLTWSGLVTDYPLYSIAYGNGLFVAAGGDCDHYAGTTYTLTSSDGELWIDHYGTDGRLQSIAFGNGVFVAVGSLDPDAGCGGTAMISADGAQWTPLDTAPWTQTVVYGNGRFVTADSSGDIWTSIEGRTWQFQTNLSNLGKIFINLKKLVYANHTFFAFSPLFTSEDGMHWVFHGDGGLNSLTYANGACITVGDNGAIMQSDPVPPTETSFGLGLRFASVPEVILSGGINRAFCIESRDDLNPANAWQALTNLYPNASPFYWGDAQAAPGRQRFYRALMLP